MYVSMKMTLQNVLLKQLHIHLSVEIDPREILPYETSIQRELFKRWISVRETNCIIHWIEIYPVDSAIQLLNNWGQYNWKGMVKFIYMRPAS